MSVASCELSGGAEADFPAISPLGFGMWKNANLHNSSDDRENELEGGHAHLVSTVVDRREASKKQRQETKPAEFGT